MDSKHGRKPRWVIRWIKGKKVFREVKYCWLLSRMRLRSFEWKSTVNFLKVGGNDNYCSEFKNECTVGEGSSSVFPHLHCTLHTHTSAHTHAHTYTHTYIHKLMGKNSINEHRPFFQMYQFSGIIEDYLIYLI
jgi:hypothetical protein